MGDPKKIRKKYSTPGHPWNKVRLDAEAELTKTFGLKNKKEIWKANAILKDLTTQAKALVTRTDAQAELEKDNLLKRVATLGFSSSTPSIDDILALKTEDVLSRRLQTVVFKNQLSRSIGQARQFIVHRHICVNGMKVTVPSYQVKAGETVTFSESSTLFDEEHPERYHEPVAKEDKKSKDDKKLKDDKKKKVVEEEIEVDDSLLKVSDEEVAKKIEIEDDEVEK